MTQHTPFTGDAELAELDRLTGTWKVSGGAEGVVTYRWLEGGRFLLQDVSLQHEGQRITGLEVIGRERPFGAEEPGQDLKSRFYDSQGNTLDYVYELTGDTLTIWGGEKGSPAYFRGDFNDDGTAVTGAWVYPGGGGYESAMTRIA
ncbi:hypothetical protein ACFQVC_27185 [Streptomyces monticola]|uniref:DUF1579 domain-containing protein n=1 Tax=Streptomyces monticola TaxID=2666263 RepID=A0ABW2JR69_9ACTN